MAGLILFQPWSMLLEQVECFRQRGTGFYAVAIGSFRLDHLDKGLFDHQWVYQSSSGKVIELQSS